MSEDVKAQGCLVCGGEKYPKQKRCTPCTLKAVKRYNRDIKRPELRGKEPCRACGSLPILPDWNENERFCRVCGLERLQPSGPPREFDDLYKQEWENIVPVQVLDGGP